MHRTIGIIGGVSPESTVTYYQTIGRLHREATGGHDYPRIVIGSIPFGPVAEASHAGDWDTIARLVQAEGDALAAAGADFLVIAARLLLIKSRHLLPREEDPEEAGEEDVGEDLARQLREYKRYKDAATALRARQETGLRSFVRTAPRPRIERPPRFGEIPVSVLAEALRRALAEHPPSPPVDAVVAPIVVHIADCVASLRRAVHRYPRVRLTTVLRAARSRLEVVVTVLAVLEMVKQQELRATQGSLFGEVFLERRTPDPEAEIAPLDLSEYGEEP